ncbi:acetate--CoA ligase family protein [Pseudonocardia eucalypti]|uniref:Acetate--CoA ligase family protein n=1 Tax=Pseudonocardia eucalypti TaxID=648755 RepID=A0ABP9QP41_9PSEU|nr:acetyltransferase [Pseudonocardia eucalypti]
MAGGDEGRGTAIGRLFRPRSVAVVGASDDPERIGGRPVALLRRHGYPGEIYPVNPKYRTVQGLPCVPDIESLPPDVDLYVIALPARLAVDAVARAGAHGAKAAVVFGGGFAETGDAGRALQEALGAAAAAHNIALVGPNTVGLASFAHRGFPTFTTALAGLGDIEPGRIALVSQSGGFAFNLFAESYAAGARFAHVVGSGNEAGLRFPDYLEHLADDPLVDSVIGYLEGSSDGAALAAAFERLRVAGKPAFVLKTGASRRGQRAVATHTAQLSGDDQAWDALFGRYGVTRLHSIDEVVDVARALSLGTPRAGVAITTNSGGTAVYLADAAERFGVPLAELGDATRDRLVEALPDFAHVTNPIDLTAQVVNDRGLLPKALRILDDDPGIGLLLVFLGAMPDLSDRFIDALRGLASDLATPLVLSWAGVPERVRQAAAAAGLTVCADPARVLRGLGTARNALTGLADAPGLSTSAMALRTNTQQRGDPASAVPEPADAVPEPVGNGAFAGHPLPDGRLGLDEWQSMRLLEGHGLRLPARELVTSEDEAVAAAEKLGYPVVAKVLDPFLPHRAKAGAVATGLDGEEALRAAFRRFAEVHRAREVLVAEQVPIKAELITGVLADPVFGTRAVIGSGGVLANEIADARTVIPPYTPDYLAKELTRLRLSGALTAELPLPELADEVSRVANALAAVIERSGGRLRAVECNPLAVSDGAVTVLDALAVLTEEDTP